VTGVYETPCVDFWPLSGNRVPDAGEHVYALIPDKSNPVGLKVTLALVALVLVGT
jgi:hypothetical protein